MTVALPEQNTKVDKREEGWYIESPGAVEGLAHI